MVFAIALHIFKFYKNLFSNLIWFVYYNLFAFADDYIVVEASFIYKFVLVWLYVRRGYIIMTILF